MLKYFLECAVGTLGIISIVTCIGWYSSYRKYLDLKNSEDIIKNQLLDVEENADGEEHYVQKVDEQIQQLNQKIARLKKKNLKLQGINML